MQMLCKYGELWNTLQHTIHDLYKYDDIIENLNLQLIIKILELSTIYEYKDESIHY